MPVFLTIVLGIALIIFGPLALLWSLNTLFPALAIEYTGWTWLAAFFLSAPFASRSK